MRGQATVLRIDLLSGVGREAARAYGVRMVPTTLLFDGEGRVVLRETGLPDAERFRVRVAELVAQTP
mgnify:CR=1 FL=1